MTVITEIMETKSEAVAAPCILSSETSQCVVALEGFDVILTMQLAPSGGVPTAVCWTRGEQELIGERYAVSENNNTVHLSVQRVTHADAGQYTMVAKNMAGEARGSVMLQVDAYGDTGGADDPAFLRRLSDLAVKVGTRTRFLVEIRSSSDIKVTWHRSDRPVEEGERFKFIHEGNFFCVDVAPVTVEDGGRWTCLAENASGRSSCSSHLNVLVPKAYKSPEFLEELRAILTEGGTVSLECKVVGVPTPVLRWYKDGKEIKAGDVFALTANPEDPTSLGTYTCEAVNCMGKTYSSSRVHVVGKGSREGSLKPADSLAPAGPPPTFTQELGDKKVKIGEPLTLACHVGVPPWPKSIAWYNKDGRVDESDKYHVMEDGLGGYMIETLSAETADEGEWKCVATNSDGSMGFSKAIVTMTYPKNYRKPRFLESLKAILTEEGLVSFECKVVGFPTPQLRWFKDGQELKPGDVYQLTGTNSLGSYSCIAKNLMGEATSSAELTVEDIQSQLSEEERLQLFSTNQPPKFLHGLKSCEAKINEHFRLTVQVSISPEPKISWYRDDEQLEDSERYHAIRENLGVCHMDVKRVEIIDQAEWKCVATNDFGHSVTSCFMKLIIPKHFKKPRFLESLRAILSEEGAVNLECKVIGVPQPVLKWYKDGEELKPGDIHRIISGEDGRCCLGTYTCEANNCMGVVSSSASLLGFEERLLAKPQEHVSLEQSAANMGSAGHMLARNTSLSTIHEERTSQMYDPATEKSLTIDERAEVSFSFDGKEVSVSLYETPDLTEEEALQVLEMYADELSEHVSEHNVVELPPMRFTKESQNTGNLLMEAVVIDVTPEFFASAADDDLRTDADIEDLSISEAALQPGLPHDEEDDGIFDELDEEFLDRALTSSTPFHDPPRRPPRKKSSSRGDSEAISDNSFHSVSAGASKGKTPSEHFTDANAQSPDNDSRVGTKTFESARGSSGEQMVVDAADSSGKRKTQDDEDLSEGKKKKISEPKSDHGTQTGAPKRVMRSVESGQGESFENIALARSQADNVALKMDLTLRQDSEKIVEEMVQAVQETVTSEVKQTGDMLAVEGVTPDEELTPKISRKKIKTSESQEESVDADIPPVVLRRKKKAGGGEVVIDTMKLERAGDAPLFLQSQEDIHRSSDKDDSYSEEGDGLKTRLAKQREEDDREEQRLLRRSSSFEINKEDVNLQATIQSEIENITKTMTDREKRLSGLDYELPRLQSPELLDPISYPDPASADKGEPSLLDNLTQSLLNIQKGLSSVENKVITELEPKFAQSSLSVLESLSQPISDIQKGLALAEEKSSSEELTPGKAGLAILENLSQPIKDFQRGLANIEQQAFESRVADTQLESTQYSILENVARPVEEFNRNVELIQQLAMLETTTGDESLADVSNLPSATTPAKEIQKALAKLGLRQPDDVDESLADTPSLRSYGTPPQDNQDWEHVYENVARSYAKSEDASLAEVPSIGGYVSPVDELQMALTNISQGLLPRRGSSPSIRSYATPPQEIHKPLVQIGDKVLYEAEPLIQMTNVPILQTVVYPVQDLQRTFAALEQQADEEARGDEPIYMRASVSILEAFSQPIEELRRGVVLIEQKALGGKSDENIGALIIESINQPMEELERALAVIEQQNILESNDDDVAEMTKFTILQQLAAPIQHLVRGLAKVQKEYILEGTENLESKIPMLENIEQSIKEVQNGIASVSQVNIYQGKPMEANEARGIELLASLNQPLTELQRGIVQIERNIVLEKDASVSETRPSSYERITVPLQQLQTGLTQIEQFVVEVSSEMTKSTTSLEVLAEPLHELKKNVAMIQQQATYSSEEINIAMLANLTRPLQALQKGISDVASHNAELTSHKSSVQVVQSMTQSVDDLKQEMARIEYRAIASPPQASQKATLSMIGTLSEPLQELHRGLIQAEQVLCETPEEELKELDLSSWETLTKPLHELREGLSQIEKVVFEDVTPMEKASATSLEILSPMIHELQKGILSIQQHAVVSSETQQTGFSLMDSIASPLLELQRSLSTIIEEPLLETETYEIEVQKSNKSILNTMTATVQQLRQEISQIDDSSVAVASTQNKLAVMKVLSEPLYALHAGLSCYEQQILVSSKVLSPEQDSLKALECVSKPLQQLTQQLISVETGLVQPGFDEQVKEMSVESLEKLITPLQEVHRGIEIFTQQAELESTGQLSELSITKTLARPLEELRKTLASIESVIVTEKEMKLMVKNPIEYVTQTIKQAPTPAAIFDIIQENPQFGILENLAHPLEKLAISWSVVDENSSETDNEQKKKVSLLALATPIDDVQRSISLVRERILFVSGEDSELMRVLETISHPIDLLQASVTHIQETVPPEQLETLSTEKTVSEEVMDFGTALIQELQKAIATTESRTAQIYQKVSEIASLNLVEGLNEPLKKLQDKMNLVEKENLLAVGIEQLSDEKVSLLQHLVEPIEKIQQGIAVIEGKRAVGGEKATIFKAEILESLSQPFKDLQHGLELIEEQVNQETEEAHLPEASGFSILQILAQPITDIKRNIAQIEQQVILEAHEEELSEKSRISALQTLAKSATETGRGLPQVEQQVLMEARGTDISEKSGISKLQTQAQSMQEKQRDVAQVEQQVALEAREEDLSAKSSISLLKTLAQPLEELQRGLAQVEQQVALEAREEDMSEKSSASLLKTLAQPLEELQRGLAQVEQQVALEAREEDMSEKSSTSLLKTLAQPLEELQRGLAQVEQQVALEAREEDMSEKSSASLLKTLAQPLEELQRGLAQVEQQVALEAREEDMSEKSSASLLKTLAQPLEELQRGLAQVEQQVALEAREEDMSEKSSASLLKTLAQPLEELQRGLAQVEQQVALEAREEDMSEKSSASLLKTLAQPLEELQRGLAQVEQQVALEAREEDMSEKSSLSMLQTLAQPIQELQRGLAQVEQQFAFDAREENISSDEGRLSIFGARAELGETSLREVASKQQQVVLDANVEEISEKTDVEELKTSANEQVKSPRETVCVQEQILMEPAAQELSRGSSISDLKTWALPVQEVLKQLAEIQQQFAVEFSTPLSDREDPSGLKTLAQPIQDLHQALEQIGEQIVMEGDTELSQRENLSYLATLAKPIQEIQSGIAFITEQYLLEAGAEAMSEKVDISLLKTLAEPLKELERQIVLIEEQELLEGVESAAISMNEDTIMSDLPTLASNASMNVVQIEEQLVFEPEARSLSDFTDASEQQLKPARRSQRDVAVVEQAEIFEGQVASLAEFSKGTLEIARPVQEVLKQLAEVQQQFAVEFSTALSDREDPSGLKTLAQPIQDLHQALVQIGEQIVMEGDTELTQRENLSYLTTLAKPIQDIQTGIALITEQHILEAGAESMSEKVDISVLKTLAVPLKELERQIVLIEEQELLEGVESAAISMNEDTVVSDLPTLASNASMNVVQIEEQLVFEPEARSLSDFTVASEQQPTSAKVSERQLAVAEQADVLECEASSMVTSARVEMAEQLTQDSHVKAAMTQEIAVEAGEVRKSAEAVERQASEDVENERQRLEQAERVAEEARNKALEIENEERARKELEETLAREKQEKEEKDRLKKETDDAERKKKDLDEKARKKKEREVAERLRLEEDERIRLQDEEANRIELEMAERIRKQDEEAERLRLEELERERQNEVELERVRLETEEKERLEIELQREREEAEFERREQEAREKLEKVQAEMLALEKEEAEKKKREEEDEIERQIELEKKERKERKKADEKKKEEEAAEAKRQEEEQIRVQREYEEEQKRKAEEDEQLRKVKEQEELQLKETEQRKKIQEEEEKLKQEQKREEQSRKEKEQEELKKKEEEVKLQQEENERKQREEELKRKEEEQLRKTDEDEERKQKEEEERMQQKKQEELKLKEEEQNKKLKEQEEEKLKQMEEKQKQEQEEKDRLKKDMEEKQVKQKEEEEAQKRKEEEQIRIKREQEELKLKEKEELEIQKEKERFEVEKKEEQKEGERKRLEEEKEQARILVEQEDLKKKKQEQEELRVKEAELEKKMKEEKDQKRKEEEQAKKKREQEEQIKKQEEKEKLEQDKRHKEEEEQKRVQKEEEENQARKLKKDEELKKKQKEQKEKEELEQKEAEQKIQQKEEKERKQKEEEKEKEQKKKDEKLKLENEKKKAEEELCRKKEEEEKKQKVREKEESERKLREEEGIRLKKEEEELKQKELEAKKQKEADKLKKEQEEEKLKKQKELDEIKKKEEEQIRLKKEEEELKQKELEVKKQKEADKLKKEQEEEKLKKQKELDEVKKKEEEQIRLKKEEEELKQKELEVKKQKEAEELKKEQEEEKLKKQKELDEIKKKEEEQKRLKKEKEELKQKELEVKKQKEAEKLKKEQEEESKKQKELDEIKKKEEEQIRLKKEEEELKQKELEVKKQKEADKLKKEQEEEESKKQKELDEIKKKEEEELKQKKLEAKKQKEAEKLKKKREEEEVNKKKELDELKKKEEEELKQKELEQVEKQKEAESLNKKREEEELQKQKELVELKKKEEEQIRIKKEEEEIRQKEQEQVEKQKELDEIKKKEEEQMKLKKEEEELKKRELEQAKKLKDEEKLKKETEEHAKKQKEQDEIKQKDEEQKKKQLEEAEQKQKELEQKKKKEEEEELKKKEEDQRKKLKADEELKKNEAEKKKKQKEIEKLKKQEDEEKKKRKEEEEQKQKEEEQKKKNKEMEEIHQKELELRKQKEQEDQKKRELERTKQEEEHAKAIKVQKESIDTVSLTDQKKTSPKDRKKKVSSGKEEAAAQADTSSSKPDEPPATEQPVQRRRRISTETSDDVSSEQSEPRRRRRPSTDITTSASESDTLTAKDSADQDATRRRRVRDEVESTAQDVEETATIRRRRQRETQSETQETNRLRKAKSFDHRPWADDAYEMSDTFTESTLTSRMRPRSRADDSSRNSSEDFSIDTTASRRSRATESMEAGSRDAHKKPSFCTRLTDRTAAQGSRIKLMCSVLGSPEPKVEWLRDGLPLPMRQGDTSKYRQRLEDGLAHLEVLNASTSDSGEFTCVARNVHGEASTTATLKVFSGFEPAPFPPTFTRGIKDAYHFSDDELVLECRVRSQPPPRVTWLKDNVPLRPSSRYQQTELADGVCRLVINGPEGATDSGQYTCRAENAVWTDQISHTVIFEGRENHMASRRMERSGNQRVARDGRRPHFSSVLTDHLVPSGGTIALQVEIRGGARPDVSWLRGTEPLAPTSSRVRTFEESGVYTLMVSDARDTEAGIYTCRAANAYGHVDTTAAVEVVRPGSVRGGRPAMFMSRPDQDMSVTLGEDITISFRVQGDPKPRVIWMKGTRDITNSQRSLKETLDDYVRLTLKRALPSDAGTYCIMAKNVYGCDRSFVTVQIRQRARSLTPSISHYPQDTFAILRDVRDDMERSKLRDVPAAVGGEPVVVESGKNWLTLAWPKGESRGGIPVLAYKVEAWQLGQDGGARWQEMGISPINSFDAFNLKAGNEYQFRITPRNRYGWGESVTSRSPITIGRTVELPEFVQILPGQLKALSGSNIRLECQVRGDPTPEVRWYRDATLLDPTNPRLSSDFNGSQCRLSIEELTDEDSGRYMCEATNKKGRVSTFARLLVVSDPKIWIADNNLKRGIQEDEQGSSTSDFPPQFTMRLRDRRVQMTYPVRLTCQVVGRPAPKITWCKDGQEVTQDDEHSFSNEDHFYTLELSHTGLEHSGCYSVTARNNHGAVSCKCHLVVDKGIRAYVAPDFLGELEAEVTIREGGELRLAAQVEAYPTVGVMWHRDGVRLRPSRRAVMTLDHDGGVELAIGGATLRDAGVYSCTATNEVGRAETSAKVRVVATTTKVPVKPPQVLGPEIPYSAAPLWVTKPRSTDAVEGDTVIIQCEVVGDPKPDVWWLRDFLKPDYYRDAPHFRRLGEGPQYRLEIPRAKLDFTGAYSVIARNTHGEAKAVISLQIYAKGQGKETMEHSSVKHGAVQTLPQVKRELKDLRCCDGDAVTLECCVDATPTPDVRWEKEGRLVPLGGDFQADFDGETARLSIHQVYPEDEGEYTCVVYNELGKASTSACLVVDVPEEKETLLSQHLSRPPGLLSTTSTPMSTPRNTPRTTPSRSKSPSMPRQRERDTTPSSYGAGRTRRLKVTSPKFYAVPHNRVAEEGETIRFQCAIAGHPTPWVTWDKDGLLVTPNARLTITEKDDLRVLELTEVTVEDAGLYRITLENEVGRIEASARLEVIGHNGARARGSIRAWSASPRTSPTFGRRLIGSAARAGNRLALDCEIRGTPSPVPSWYRNGELVVMTSRVTPTWDGKVARLEVYPIDADDAGVYCCLAENEVGVTQCTARVLILDEDDPSQEDRLPPVFLQELQENITVAEGHGVELQAQLCGAAPIEVVWSRDNVEIPDCADFRYVTHDDGRVALRLADMFPEDAGVYRCEAFNSFGDAVTWGRLTVADEENAESLHQQPQFVKKPTSVLVSPGRQASFCARLASTQGVTLSWTVGGRSVDSDPRYQVENDGDVSILHISAVDATDAGVVMCTATSSTSSSSTCAELTVMKDEDMCRSCANHETRSRSMSPVRAERTTPRGRRREAEEQEMPATLLRGPADTTVLRGDQVVLKAAFAGCPTPQVRWLRAGRELVSDGRLHIVTDETESRLTLDSITADEGGKYVVSVENTFGADCHFASVAVEGPPDPPGSPPTASPADDASCVVAWSSAPYDGGCIVTGYSLEMRREEENDWTLVSDECHSFSHMVRGLTPGEGYVFRVRAINVHGPSEPSTESKVVKMGPPDQEEELFSPAFAPRVVQVESGTDFKQRFEILEELGKGRFGVVHKVSDRQTNQKLAAKFIRCIKSKDREKVQEEIDIMNCLRHPKLLQLAAAFENPREIVMVMELISGGELFERVVADDFTLTERDCILFMRQIVEGVEYMHKNAVVHLDLKPENIMCYTRTSHQIKLIDFGLAKKLDPAKPVRVLFGTPEFIPPEIINYENIGLESDMWSVGVICYVLLSGLSPFMGDSDADTFANITRADFDFDDEAFDAISQESKDFISSLLIEKKEKRLTASECLEHKWLAQHDESMSNVALCTDKLKKFIIRRKWQKTGNAIRALGRMATLSAASRRNSAASTTSTSPRPSLCGFSRMSSLNEEDIGLALTGNNRVFTPTNECSKDSNMITMQDSYKENGFHSAGIVESALSKSNRARMCSERSDSGISDCSSSSNPVPHSNFQCTSSAPLLNKKFSICEGVEYDFSEESKGDDLGSSVNGRTKTPSSVHTAKNYSKTDSLKQQSSVDSGYGDGVAKKVAQLQVSLEDTKKSTPTSASKPTLASSQKKVGQANDQSANYKKALAFWKP